MGQTEPSEAGTANGWIRLQKRVVQGSKCTLPDLLWGRQSRSKVRRSCEAAHHLTETITPRRPQWGDFPHQGGEDEPQMGRARMKKRRSEPDLLSKL
jgi:hypothetical protein